MTNTEQLKIAAVKDLVTLANLEIVMVKRAGWGRGLSELGEIGLEHLGGLSKGLHAGGEEIGGGLNKMLSSVPKSNNGFDDLIARAKSFDPKSISVPRVLTNSRNDFENPYMIGPKLWNERYGGLNNPQWSSKALPSYSPDFKHPSFDPKTRLFNLSTSGPLRFSHYGEGLGAETEDTADSAYWARTRNKPQSGTPASRRILG